MAKHQVRVAIRRQRQGLAADRAVALPSRDAASSRSSRFGVGQRSPSMRASYKTLKRDRTRPSWTQCSSRADALPSGSSYFMDQRDRPTLARIAIGRNWSLDTPEAVVPIGQDQAVRRTTFGDLVVIGQLLWMPVRRASWSSHFIGHVEHLLCQHPGTRASR